MKQSQNSQTVASLAMLCVCFNTKDHRDYVDLFVPFLATWLCKSKIDKLPELNSIRDEMEKEFGLRIPLNPLKAIVERAEKRGLVRKHGKEIEVNKPLCKKSDFSKKSEEQSKRQEDVINEFIEYCKTEDNVVIAKEEAEDVLLDFLKSRDSELLYFDANQSLLPHKRTNNLNRFLFRNFLKLKYEEGSEIFRAIRDFAIGNILASCLVLRAEGSPEGKVKSLHVFVDTNLLFNLIGINGKERRDSTAELFESLHNAGAKLFIFDHTDKELNQILDNARYWIESGKYDPEKASRAARFFKDANYSITDIYRFIGAVGDRLSHYRISVTHVSDPNLNKQYQISEQDLFQSIKETYKKRNGDYDEESLDETIRVDIKSIGEIHKQREGGRPRTLRDAKAFLVTSNPGLALASLNFERREKETDSGFHLGLCVTDVFLGTLVWIYDKKEINTYMQKKIIADCIAALDPDEETFKSYVREAKKLRDQSTISLGEFSALTETPIARTMLMENITLGQKKVSIRTPIEILEKIKESFVSENDKVHDGEMENAKAALGDLRKIIAESDRSKEALEYRIERGANNIAIVFLATINVLIAILTFACLFLASVSTLFRISASAIVLCVSWFVSTKYLKERVRKYVHERFFR
jgi:hypothetical protein